MNLLRKIALNKNELLIYKKNKLVVIYSKRTASHIILSEEVYNFIEMASNKHITIKEFIEVFQDEEDKKYMNQVLSNLIKMEALYYEGHEKFISHNRYIGESVYLCLTKRCNLKCKHCCSNCSNEEIDLLSSEDLKNIIDIIKSLKPKAIVLTGGEPLVREDFKEIVNYIKQNIDDVFLVLSTNGTLVSDKNIDFIVKNFTKIDISLDGVDEETCSTIRGKGVFNKVLFAVKMLQERKFTNIHLSMVFGDKNAHLKERFEALNESLETTSVERYFIPEGRGIENVLEYYFNDATLPISIPNYFEKNKEKKSKHISSCACDALKSQIFINYDGNIYPCPSLIKEEYRVGSIFDMDLLLNIRNGEVEKTNAYSNLQNIHPYNFKKCSKCDINVFCWHCPALLDSVKDNSEEFNKWCSSMKISLNKIIWDEEVI